MEAPHRANINSKTNNKKTMMMKTWRSISKILKTSKSLS